MASGLCLLIVFGIAGCVPGYFDDTSAENALVTDDQGEHGAAALGAVPVAAVAILGVAVGGRLVRFAVVVVVVWER